MKYYQKRMDELEKKAQSLAREAEREMREGSGARAMEYSKQSDAAMAEAKKWRDALTSVDADVLRRFC